MRISESSYGRVRKILRHLLPFLGRRYPLYKGCGRLANISAMQRLSQVEDPECRAHIRNGQTLWIRLDDFVGRSLYYFGDFDRRLTWLLGHVLRPGDVFVDVGANYGWLSLWAAQIVGPSGRVHAFEPQPQVVELLRRSIADNHLAQVIVHSIALSDTEGHMDLWVPDGKLGSASLTRIGETAGRRETVQVHHAGDYLTSVCPGPVRLMKIDVEGHEDHVIRGATEWLRSADVDMVLFEWNDARPLDGSDTARVLSDLGYVLYQIEEYPWRMRIVAMSRGSKQANDFIAVRPERQDLLAALRIGRPLPRRR